MKTKMTVVLLTLMVSIASFGRNNIEATTLRKLVLESDVIPASPNQSITSNYANDYSVEQFYMVNSIDTIMKNATQYKNTDKIRIQQRISDYSSCWSKDLLYCR